ncbi:unnamed protein product, partial [Meganyctiphanes norvegica]
MLAVLIFDQLNDIVYLRADQKFVRHVHKLAVTQGLAAEDETHSQVDDLDQNIVVQLFSPLVTSQRIMATQFNNPYTSLTCEDGTTIVFQDYAGHLFVVIGEASEEHLQRVANIAIRIVKLTVGPCPAILKKSAEKCHLLDTLLEAWQKLYAREQSYLVEAVERLVVNSDLSSAAVKVLSSVLDKLRSSRELTPAHAIFFVRNKLLALYSCRSAQELSASDLLFLNLLVEAQNIKEIKTPEDPESDGIEEVLCDSGDEEAGEADLSTDSGDASSPPGSPRELGGDLGNIKSTVLLLQTELCGMTPHLVHYQTLSEGVSLVIVSEVQRTLLSAHLTTLLSAIEEMSQGNVNARGKAVLETCDSTVRKARDLAKRLPRGNVTERLNKVMLQVSNRWESVKQAGLESWLKSPGEDGDLPPSRVDASLTSLTEIIRMAWRISCLGVSTSTAASLVEAAVNMASERMADYSQFLEVKALRNMTLSSRSALSINKYLEEFPGLVHFLYIDRANHLLTAPTLQHTSDGATPKATESLTASRVWWMVEFARSHLSQGHLSLMWKDTSFNYAYFLWFEDLSGNPLKPSPLEDEATQLLPIPGLLSQDFYNHLAQHLFPG